MADDEQFSLCWNNFNSNLSAGFHESLCRGDLVDVTLAAEGQFIKAHRLVLSVCSPYFRKMFTQMPTNQHAFVFLKDVSHCALKDLIQFMYCGEVNVKQDALPAFISTAEALQIKGLTDGDPAPAQSPATPSTSAPQTTTTIPAQQTMTSPRVKQQRTTSTVRSQQQYKFESADESGDDNKSTQIVIQTSNSTPVVTSQPQTIQLQVQQPQQQTVQIQPQTQKRGAAKNITTHMPKRTKIIQQQTAATDPLESTEPTITVQTISESKSVATTSEPEFIDLPMDLPTKSEPEYADDTGDVETVEQEQAYVEDDSYGDMKYDDHYFTENDETGTAGGGNTSTNANTATVKLQQSGTFSESYVSDAGDQSATEAQETIKFIRSQKKNAQLVYKGYIYNKKLTQANGHTTWRCADVLKLRCKAVCITKKNKLISARRQHIHVQHWQRIGNRPLYDIEEELGEYIEIKADDPKFAEMYQVSHIELAKDQFKIFVPANDNLQQHASNKKFETIIEEIIK